jgi:hypothetical protein
MLFLSTVAGSRAYGLDTETSDTDIVNVVVPPLEKMFPHAFGKIPGFAHFDYHSTVAVKNHKEEGDETTYDIVRFFNLLAKSNPNVVEILFFPERCWSETSEGWKTLVENRDLFITKKLKLTFVGYALDQMKYAERLGEKTGDKRRKLFTDFGYDTKAAMHAYRIILYCTDLLAMGEICFGLHRDFLLDLRSGKYSLESVKKWFNEDRENIEYITKNYPEVQEEPDLEKINDLLANCLSKMIPNFQNYVWKENDLLLN